MRLIKHKTHWAGLVLGIIILAVAGCEGLAPDGSAGDDDDSGTTAFSDAGTTPDATIPPLPVAGVQVTLRGGEVVSGQLVATYDHSNWWSDASNEITYAIFDPSAFAEYPNDRCLRFLSSNDIVSMVDVMLPAGTVVYRDMLRTKGMVYGHIPIQGTMYVGGGNHGEHSKENGLGEFAWDIVRANASGKSYTGSGLSNNDYLIWNAPLVLPIAGQVVEVIRDQPDNTPGQLGDDQNMILVHIGGQFYLAMLHMRQNSIPQSVQVNATLPAGAPVGNVGNSGISIEPHLHITLVWYDTVTARSWGVPSEWANVWSATTGPQGSQMSAFLVPQMGMWVSGSVF